MSIVPERYTKVLPLKKWDPKELTFESKIYLTYKNRKRSIASFLEVNRIDLSDFLQYLQVKYLEYGYELDVESTTKVINDRKPFYVTEMRDAEIFKEVLIEILELTKITK